MLRLKEPHSLSWRPVRERMRVLDAVTSSAARVHLRLPRLHSSHGTSCSRRPAPGTHAATQLPPDAREALNDVTLPERATCEHLTT